MLHLLEAASAGFVVDMHSMSPALQRLLSSSVLYVSASQYSLHHTCLRSPQTRLPCLVVNICPSTNQPCSRATTICTTARTVQGRAQPKGRQAAPWCVWDRVDTPGLVLCLAPRLLGCAGLQSRAYAVATTRPSVTA